MFSYVIFGITYGFVAAVQPGPLQTYLISQTIKRGWRSTLPAAFAPVISDGPIIVFVLFLLSTMPDSFIAILRVGGGLFLLYLGFRALKAWQAFDANQSISDKSSPKTLLHGVIVNLLNPAPYLGWSLIMGPVFIEGWRKAPINGIAMITGFYLTIILILAGCIILFGFARKFGPNVSKNLIGISSIVLVAFGIYQLWSGIHYFV